MRYDDISDATQKLILEKSAVRKIKKNDYLFQEGQKANHLYFVSKGALRLYALDDDFKEHIIRFAFERDTIGDFDAFLCNVKGELNLQAMENSIVLEVSSTDLAQLFQHSDSLSLIYKQFLEHELSNTQKRIINHLVKNAEGRYIYFLRAYKNQNNRIPDRHIASFIGVTPEFFSKLKKKKMREFLKLP